MKIKIKSKYIEENQSIIIKLSTGLITSKYIEENFPKTGRKRTSQETIDWLNNYVIEN